MEYPSGDFQQHSWSSFNIHSSANRLKLTEPEVLRVKDIHNCKRNLIQPLAPNKDKIEFSTISLAV